MSDGVLDRYLGPGKDGRPSDPNDPNSVEDLQAFGYVRGIQSRAIMLELRKRDGDIIAIPYSTIERLEYDPSIGITIHSLGSKFMLRGRNLNAEIRPQTRLFAGLTRQRVCWIQESAHGGAVDTVHPSITSFDCLA